MASRDGVQLREDVQYRVLGPLTVMVDGRSLKLGGPRQQTVLAVLLSRANRTVSQDSLIDHVWSGEPPEAAKATLQGYVYGLRRELGADAIARHGDGYQVQADADRLDSLRFEKLVAGARSRISEEPEQVFKDLTEALALWNGTPYAGLEGNMALLPEITRLEELRLDAVELRIDAKLVLGEHGSATAELDTLVREHPLRERFRAQQMLALYRAGRQADALRAFQAARRHLAEELGIEPSPDLRDLEQRILEQDLALEAAVRTDTGPAASIDVVRGFELREKIGSGAFGNVRRAYQPSVGREVAIKIIRPEFANDPGFVRRFEREARIVANLEHPHVVPLFDFWRDPTGAYLVMPYLRGGSLAHGLRTGGWNLEPAVRLIQQVGSALAYAHRHGVLHRDIKAANVLLDEEGNAYLTDFGIATVGSSGNSDDTSAGFLAPEVRAGGELTAHSDQYALAMLIHQVLTGLTPASDGPVSSISDARPGLGNEFSGVLKRATSEEPSDRYPSIDAFLRAVRMSLGIDIVPTPTPDDQPRSTAGVRNPYKGLRAFREDDASDFHGRDAAIADVLHSLSEHDLVTVVGPSGSGKSSVVRAGVLPALRAGAIAGSRSWLVADMYPGERPLQELETALLGVAVDRPADMVGDLMAPGGLIRTLKRILPDPSTTLLLVIDQFEELFSPQVTENDRQTFVNALTETIDEPAARLKVVLTLRADFLDRPLSNPTLRDAMAGGVTLLGPPSRDGLTQAIAAPARAVGLDIEPGLVGRILADVEHQAGALPLLQFALTELVAERESDALTIAGYERTGGVLGSLSRRAEETFQGLGERGHVAAEQTFLRLVTVDEGVADTRLRVRLGELRTLNVDQEAVGDVLRRFATHRLLTFDHDPVTRGPTVEIAHEALLTEWPRLRGWLDTRRDTLVLARRLRAAANEWREAEQDEAFLLHGGRLDQATALISEGSVPLTSLELELVETSALHHSKEARRLRSRRRRVLALLSALLTFVSGLAVIVAMQRSAAIDEAAETHRRNLVAGGVEALDQDPELALLLGLEAATISTKSGEPLPADSLELLNRALRSNRVVERFETPATAIDLSTDAGLMALGFGGQVRLIDVASGETVGEHLGDSPISRVAFSPDGALLAVGYRAVPMSGPYEVAILDTSTGERTSTLHGPALGGNLAMDWSDDGSRLAVLAWTIDAEVSMFDVESARRLGTGEVGRARDLAFFDDVTVILAERTRDVILRWSPGSPLEEIETPGSAAYALDVDPAAGTVAITAVEPLRLELWDLGASEPLWSVFLPQPNIQNAAGEVEIDPRGETVAVADGNGGLTTYTMDSGLARVRGNHEGTILTELSAGDGDLLLSRSGTNVVTLWDVSQTGPETIPLASSQPPCGITIDPEGSRVAATGVDGTLTLSDINSGETILGLADQNIGHERQVTLSRDWKLAAWTDENCETWIRDGTTMAPLVRLPVCTSAKAFNRDASLLLLSGSDACGCAPQDGAVSIVSTSTGSEVTRLDGEEVWGRAAAFVSGPSDRESVIANIDGTLRFHDVQSGAELFRMEHPREWITIAVDPAERYLAASSDFNVQIFDLQRLLAGAKPEDATVAELPVDFSPWGLALDGAGHVAAAGDAQLHVYDIASGRLVAAPETSSVTAPFAAFVPGEPVLVHAAAGGVLRRYYLGEAIVDRARAKATRGWTESECERYLGQPCDGKAGDT